MTTDTVSSISDSIKELTRIAGKLRTESALLCAITIIAAIIMTMIGALTQMWIVTLIGVPSIAVIFCVGLYFLFKIRKISEQNEKAKSDFEKEKESIEREAQLAFQLLEKAKKNINDIEIHPKAAGEWMSDWKRRLGKATIHSFWVKMPEILGTAFDAEYDTKPGPAEKIETPEEE